MNAQSLYKLLVVGCCCYCLMACGEDNGPLSLINTEGNETLIDITGNTLQLSPFSKGESFYIDGGDGAYTIDNNNDEVVTFSYDGRILTLCPVAQGSAVITIQDHDNHIYQLQVEVAYPKQTFEVTAVDAKAIGDDLTQMETELLQEQIQSDIYVGVGGKFAFTYMVPDSTEGEVEMIPVGSRLSRKGVFQSGVKYAEDGTLYEAMTIHLTSGEEVIYSWYQVPSDSSYVLTQDVTEYYRLEYSKVQEAYAVSILFPLNSIR